MALKVLQGRMQPYGQFDGLDSVYLTVKGGEVASFAYVSILQSVDKHAADENDGYVSNTKLTRPAVTTNLVSGTRPLFLVDDGIANYGTLFGQVVGGVVGSVVQGTQLGPHTATGSGKLTLWDGEGIYGVTIDACDSNPVTGLQPTNTTIAGGSPLYATAAGLLTPNVSAAFEAIVVGRFLEFSLSGSLVTTPKQLTAGLNSPSGTATSFNGPFHMAVFHFNPEV